MIEFVDSHAHLTDSAFDGDRDAVIARARESGCRAIVCIGASIEAAAASASLAAKHPGFIFATAGVHPHDAAGFDDARDGAAIREAVVQGAVGIGECGLDYHYDNAPRDVQRRVFAAHIALAAETSRPLIVHTRDAEDDTRSAIRDAATAGARGVLHCFTGSAQLADEALAAGWYVSFSGVVTFKKWDGDTLIRMVPPDRLLAETDAPYLTPVPFRGKRNESAHVPLIITQLARTRGESPEASGALVTANAVECFGLALAPAAT